MLLAHVQILLLLHVKNVMDALLLCAPTVLHSRVHFTATATAKI
jgi:hypothetical protein